VNWRPFAPHNHHQMLMGDMNIPISGRNSNDYFEDELAQVVTVKN